MLSEMFGLDAPHCYFVFSDQPLPEVREFENVELMEVDSSRPTTEAAVADGSRSIRDMLRMTQAVAAAPLDVMFFPAVYSWYPVPPKLRTMVTVLDAIAEHYPQLIFPTLRSRLFWTAKVKGAVWSSKRVLTISQAAKEEIIRYIGVAPEKIDVTSAAPNPIFSPERDPSVLASARERMGLPLSADVIVYVGGLAPHKNLLGLLDGFEEAVRVRGLANLHLALVGDFTGAGFHSNYDALLQRVSGSDLLSQRVHFTGYVSDEDLVALYSSALAAAMPSYSEGFGLPAIEAMACGAPVLSSKLGSLPEVVGEAGLYFDPFDAHAIAEAIAQMASEPDTQRSLSSLAVPRAAQFTWRRAAELTLGHLETMALGRS